MSTMKSLMRSKDRFRKINHKQLLKTGKVSSHPTPLPCKANFGGSQGFFMGVGKRMGNHVNGLCADVL